jgi:hypothetical protein
MIWVNLMWTRMQVMMSWSCTTLANASRSSKLSKAYLRAKLKEASLTNRLSSLSSMLGTSNGVCDHIYICGQKWVNWPPSFPAYTGHHCRLCSEGKDTGWFSLYSIYCSITQMAALLSSVKPRGTWMFYYDGPFSIAIINASKQDPLDAS